MTDKLNECIFLIENDYLLQEYNTIWDKVSPDIKKEFDSELVYHKNLQVTNFKSYRFLR